MELLNGMTLVTESHSLTTAGWVVLILVIAVLDIICLKLVQLKNRLSMLVFVVVIAVMLCGITGKINIPYMSETLYRVKVDSETTIKELSENYEIIGYEKGEFILKPLKIKNFKNKGADNDARNGTETELSSDNK